MASKKPVDVQEEETQVTAEDNGGALAAAQAEIAKLKAQLAAISPANKTAKPARETDYERVHRLEAEALAEGRDLWDVKVELFVPHRNPTEDPFYWICVNSRPVQIPADDTIQEMRLPFACVLVDTLANEKRSAAYRDSVQVYDPKTNPHEVEDIRSGY